MKFVKDIKKKASVVTKMSLSIQFYAGSDRFVVHNVLPSVFGGSIVTIKKGTEHTFSSRCFHLFGPSSVVVCVLHAHLNTTTAHILLL